jgi:hypothetical protein
MRLFFAGAEAALTQLPVCPMRNAMISFWSISKKLDIAKAKRDMQWGKLFVDCGAFGAYGAGQKIDVNNYAKWLIEHLPAIDFYVNLDVKDSLEETVDNMKVLEGRYKLHPMPVFPMNAPLSMFFDLVDQGYRLIALGNTHNLPRPIYHKLYCKMFARVGSMVKTGELRLHIFGQTHYDYVTAYPFYSCDAVSWIAIAQGLASTLIFDPFKGMVRARYHAKPPENFERACIQGALMDIPGRPARWWERTVCAVKVYEEYADWITRLWAQRGVTFLD